MNICSICGHDVRLPCAMGNQQGGILQGAVPLKKIPEIRSCPRFTQMIDGPRGPNDGYMQTPPARVDDVADGILHHQEPAEISKAEIEAIAPGLLVEMAA